MSNGNERNEAGETTVTNFTEAAKVPQQHSNWGAAQSPQVAIGNWINSCGRQDDMTIEDIVDACWILEPVMKYLNSEVTSEMYSQAKMLDFRKQLIRMHIRQALISYIDGVIIASVPTAAQ